MARLKDTVPQWMKDLAVKHGVSVELIMGFYEGLKGHKKIGYTKRSRTEEFFDLYYEGIAGDDDELQTT